MTTASVPTGKGEKLCRESRGAGRGLELDVQSRGCHSSRRSLPRRTFVFTSEGQPGNVKIYQVHPSSLDKRGSGGQGKCFAQSHPLFSCKGMTSSLARLYPSQEPSAVAEGLSEHPLLPRRSSAEPGGEEGNAGGSLPISPRHGSAWLLALLRVIGQEPPPLSAC